MKALIAFAATALVCEPVDQAAAVAKAVGAALQADLQKALLLLDAVDVASLPAEDAAVAACIRGRFGGNNGPADASSDEFVDRALAVYRNYWHSAMTQPASRLLAEESLKGELRELLGSRARDLNVLESELSAALKKEGYYSLQGQTGLLRELMIWSSQDSSIMQAALPEGNYQVEVVLLDGFRSLGWAHYATCGKRATAGWATDHTLFAVVPRYESLSGEEFRVTFLGHETQHFADKNRFPDLEPWELEYRAKLVELAQVSTTRSKILRKFIEDQSSDSASPHSFANRKVLAELLRRMRLKGEADLFTAELLHLQTAAREALLDDSRHRAESRDQNDSGTSSR